MSDARQHGGEPDDLGRAEIPLAPYGTTSVTVDSQAAPDPSRRAREMVDDQGHELDLLAHRRDWIRKGRGAMRAAARGVRICTFLSKIVIGQRVRAG